MKNKINILLISIILTIIVYGISIYMQKQLVEYVPTIKCFVTTSDFDAYSQVDISKIKEVDMPISIVATTKIIQNKEDLNNLYLKEKLYSGQILISNQFDTRENLSIYESEDGMEKLSIKIKSPEYSASYNIKENSIVNVYATLRDEYAKGALSNLEQMHAGDDNEGYSIVTILNGVKVLGVFDQDGTEISYRITDGTPDTILVSVTSEEARKINLIRDIATFNITELKKKKEAEEDVQEITDTNVNTDQLATDS